MRMLVLNHSFFAGFFDFISKCNIILLNYTKIIKEIFALYYFVLYIYIMISNILEEMNSPTRENYRRTEFKEIASKLEDDSNKMFDVKIKYEFSRNNGWGCQFSAMTVWSFDYHIKGTPNISKQDLIEWVKDCIRYEEDYKASFEI
jgi:hypothetical protein